jgi:tetratricopeptide (TPR) repeat protein
MGKFTAYLLSKLKNWDTPSKIAMTICLVLLVLTLITAATGGDRLRTPAIIGSMGLIVAAQGVFMWANRDMVASYTGAQRAYLAGDFKSARAILEAVQKNGQASAQVLTLLGNTYRQLGLTAESEAVLYEAVNNSPNHYFPLYGFARTLLVTGRYAESIDAFQRALENGAQTIVRFDLAEAYYRQGNWDDARNQLTQAKLYVHDEPHRALMTAFWLYKLEAGKRPSRRLTADGIGYWEAQAELFQETPYGDAVASDIDELLALTQEE